VSVLKSIGSRSLLKSAGVRVNFNSLLMADADYDPRAMIGVMEMLIAASDGDESSARVFLIHT